MGKLKIYFDALSEPCRAVYLLLKANNIAFDIDYRLVFKGDTKTKEYLTINPYGRVPCLEDEGFILAESVAIMLYIRNKYDIPDHWYPKDIKQRARIDQFMAWNHSNLREFCLDVFKERAFKHYFDHTKKEFDEKAYKESIKKVGPALQKFEDLYLKDNKFIFSDVISIADLTAVSQFAQVISGQYDFKGNHPKLVDYMERVRAITQPHFDEVFKRIYYVKDRLAEGKTEMDLLPADPYGL